MMFKVKHCDEKLSFSRIFAVNSPEPQKLHHRIEEITIRAGKKRNQSKNQRN